MTRFAPFLLLLLAACRREPAPPSPHDPASGCLTPRPAIEACKLSSDCYREDLCTSYACVSGRCEYQVRTTEGPGPVACDPGRPGDARWVCRSPDAEAPGGYCCPAKIVLVK